MFTKGAPWWLSFEFALSESDGPCCTSVELTDGTETFVDMCICTVGGTARRKPRQGQGVIITVTGLKVIIITPCNNRPMSTIPAKVLREAAAAKDATAAAAKVEKERAVLAERCETLESRCADLTSSMATSETDRVQATEALAVALAERKLVDETVGRADALVGELRAERAALARRAADAEEQCRTLQQQYAEAEAKRLSVQEAFAVEQVGRCHHQQAEAGQVVRHRIAGGNGLGRGDGGHCAHRDLAPAARRQRPRSGPCPSMTVGCEDFSSCKSSASPGG